MLLRKLITYFNNVKICFLNIRGSILQDVTWFNYKYLLGHDLCQCSSSQYHKILCLAMCKTCLLSVPVCVPLISYSCLKICIFAITLVSLLRSVDTIFYDSTSLFHATIFHSLDIGKTQYWGEDFHFEMGKYNLLTKYN